MLFFNLFYLITFIIMNKNNCIDIKYFRNKIRILNNYSYDIIKISFNTFSDFHTHFGTVSD